MGAPGYHFLCKSGHMFYEVPSRLYWDDVVNEYEQIKGEGCPCGQPFAIETCFYDEIFDCLSEEEMPPVIGEFPYLALIPDAVDLNRNSIKAYLEKSFIQYDISHIIEEQEERIRKYKESHPEKSEEDCG